MSNRKGWEMQRLAECRRALGRKCFLLDSAELAHGVQVLVYGPEGTELEDYLHTDTRVSVFVKGEEQARMTCIVDQSTRKIADILAAHGASAETSGNTSTTTKEG